MKRSKSTMVTKAISGIDSRVKSVFNTDIFGLYEGIIEKIDIENGSLNVRIPKLNNTLYEDCRIMTACNTDTSAILPTFSVNSHVIVGFTQFDLANPIIMGQISPANSVNIPYENGSIIIKNGDSGIKVTDNAINISNANGSIKISDSGIYINNKSSSIIISDEVLTIECPGIVIINGTTGTSISGSNIVLTGTNITANGEDLTKDDVGII